MKLNLITIHSENKGIKEIEPIHVAKHMQAIILELKIIVSLLQMNAYHNANDMFLSDINTFQCLISTQNYLKLFSVL